MNNFASCPATIILICINAIVFLLIRMGRLQVSKLSTSYKDTIGQRQYYRLVTSAFTHWEPLHILMNMGSLYNLGVVLEPLLGPVRFAVVYFIIMISGGFISALVHKKRSPFTSSIGASGAICGLLGVYIAIGLTFIGFSTVRSVLPTLGFLILMTASPRIDSIGHFAGLGVGIICGFLVIAVI